MVLLTKSLDGEYEPIAFFQENPRVPRHADARRCPGGDHVARHQRHEPADIADKMRHAEDHGGGIAGLHAGPVEVERKTKSLWVRNFVLGDKPRPEWPETVVAFCLDPFARAALLQATLRHIVGNHVTGDVVERVSLGDIFRRATDGKGQLNLEIYALPAFRHEYWVIWPGDAGGRFREDDGRLRNGHAGFFGVVPVVQPDAEKRRHLRDARPESGLQTHGRQNGKIEAFELL